MGLVALCTILKVPFIFWVAQGDVRLYCEIAHGIACNNLPYLEIAFAYPPYAVVLFMPALILGGVEDFGLWFSLEMLAIDAGIQLLLVRCSVGLVCEQKERLYLDSESFGAASSRSVLECIIVYNLGTFALRDILLQRFDLAPVFLMLLGLSALGGKRATLAGIALAVAIGTKLYPVIILPGIFAYAFRRRVLGRLAWGLGLGALPLVALAAYLPWYLFLVGHWSRGFQAESLYASMLWMVQCYCDIGIRWQREGDFFEVQGVVAQQMRTSVVVLWILCVGLSSMFAGWGLAQHEVTHWIRWRAMYWPILGFIAFGPVLSPQYLLWMLPVYCLPGVVGLRERWIFGLVCVLTPLIFPTDSYLIGINGAQALLLVVRNILLVALWVDSARVCLGVFYGFDRTRSVK